jgi:hypothetical protein
MTTNLTDLLRKIVWENGGFLTAADIAELTKLDKLRQILVRCGACRFTCAVQDVTFLTGIITRDGTDYVRDISLLASDEAYSLTPPTQSTSDWLEESCGGAYDGFHVSSDADSGL